MERMLGPPRLDNRFPAVDERRSLRPIAPAKWPWRDPATALLRSPEPASLRTRLYRVLAGLLIAAPKPATIAFESCPAGRTPSIVVRPRALLNVLRAHPAFRTVGLSSGPVPPPVEPPAGFCERTAALVHGPERGGRPTGDRPVDRPEPGRLAGPTTWVGVQTVWTPGPAGTIWAARRVRVAAPSSSDLRARTEAVATAAALEWGLVTGQAVSFETGGIRSRRDWRQLATGSLPRSAWFPLLPERAALAAELDGAGPELPDVGDEGHVAVLGASGAGKTWFLAACASEAIRRGRPVVVIDLHGDLAPAIAARVAPGDRSRLVCLDLSDRPVPGIAAIAPGTNPERSAAHLVAALKRLTPDGVETYWGYRLERILDSFVRLAQEAGGSLLDVHDLLTNPDHRDAARLATRSPDLVHFLDELGPVVRRNPEFLWGATARLAKVAAVPALAELLAPRDGGLPIEELLDEGRSILLRAPFALLGPEAAAFAGTLALGRIYLGQAARRTERPKGDRVLAVLDEVQALAPRLVAEMLAEGRKFGFRLLVATQFPDRLAPELRSTLSGVVREIVAFRAPLPNAAAVGEWLGLDADAAARWLVDLPPGYGLAHSPERRGLRPVIPRSLPARAADAWVAGVRATRSEFTPEPADLTMTAADEPAGARVLLAILGADEEHRPLSRAEVVRAVAELPGPAIDPAVIADRLVSLAHSQLVHLDELERFHLTVAGERWLGLGAPTHAPRESSVHRGLLLAAFRVFARHGHRLEIVRQGRFDTRVPDARFRQLGERTRAGPPLELARAFDRAQKGWAWRYFGGRDVHVEAEVSGALRAARIRHGVAKAAAHDAFVLFLVTDARRAARIRAILDEMGIPRDRGAVWALPVERPVDPGPDGPENTRALLQDPGSVTVRAGAT